MTIYGRIRRTATLSGLPAVKNAMLCFGDNFST